VATLLGQFNEEVGVIKWSYTENTKIDNLFMFNLKWNQVGYCKNGIIAESGTNYKIRVKNKDTNDYTDSPIFSIYELKVQQVPEGLKKAKPSIKIKTME